MSLSIIKVKIDNVLICIHIFILKVISIIDDVMSFSRVIKKYRCLASVVFCYEAKNLVVE